jgi:putative hydrolase of the HAD superfamily
MHKTVIVFDLDDTLFKEIDFLKSAYREIASLCCSTINEQLYNEMLSNFYAGKNVFNELVEHTERFSIEELVSIYRSHLPNISLSDGAKELFDFLVESKFPIGLITDGRSIQQRNKLKALFISETFSDIIISEEFESEKPSVLNYQYFQVKYPDYHFYYIGDNFNKDFVTPNKLGWSTIGLLDDGRNVHKQNHNLSIEYLPKYCVKSLNEIKKIIKNNEK